MKYLFIPGLPLGVVALSAWDASNPVAQWSAFVAAGLLVGGGVFVVLYALHRAINSILS